MDLEGIIDQKTMKQDKSWTRKKTGLEKKEKDVKEMQTILHEEFGIDREVELESSAATSDNEK